MKKNMKKNIFTDSIMFNKIYYLLTGYRCEFFYDEISNVKGESIRCKNLCEKDKSLCYEHFCQMINYIKMYHFMGSGKILHVDQKIKAKVEYHTRIKFRHQFYRIIKYSEEKNHNNYERLLLNISNGDSKKCSKCQMYIFTFNSQYCDLQNTSYEICEKCHTLLPFGYLKTIDCNEKKQYYSWISMSHLRNMQWLNLLVEKDETLENYDSRFYIYIKPYNLSGIYERDKILSIYNYNINLLSKTLNSKYISDMIDNYNLET
jgi:hypothetical protein